MEAAARHRLEVALVWGDDQLLDVKEVRPGEPFTIGPREDASMQVFHPATDRGPIPILELGGAGCVATVPVESRGRVRTGGRERSPLELVALGRARPVEAPFVGIRCELGVDDGLELEFGQVRLVARFEPVGRPRASPYGRPFRLRVALYLVGAVVAHHLLALAFAR